MPLSQRAALSFPRFASEKGVRTRFDGGQLLQRKPVCALCKCCVAAVPHNLVGFQSNQMAFQSFANKVLYLAAKSHT
eukprot:3696770-Amphidinium_carterae.1